ncbi:endonuclease/exonuclease/phosphatase family protein [Lentisphaera profundi]|uniref:Endonuclease/exonuclease/phosphatase family protein n=1 Tax=Lentisphaera profundi TaxID=1658616 RepID=A0ABY7VWM3_9BACT|nr:endonuclease/exonuclease/phosphatase family protein [Lentisphaera profundi]WDE96463.1 endonuclease/exonuclease/phosphatase family protein [Lentisphaera profundi]
MKRYLVSLIFLMSVASAQNIKIISYNVLYGFNHGKSIDLGKQCLKEQQADMIALQEMKGFDQEKFAILAKSWGHEHSYFYKRQPGMPLAFSSRYPISEVKELGEGVKRGFLMLKCKGIHFIVGHMTSQKLKSRQQETQYISTYIKTLMEAGEKVVILGDFNALSPLDNERLASMHELINEMRNNPKKKANLNKNNFDTSIMQSYYDLGLSDVCHQVLKGKASLKGSFPSTILEKIPSVEVQEQHLRRIDFILADPATAKQAIQADIPKGGALEQISDHYPLIVEFYLNL